jgi:hypothetical protein
LGYFTLEQGQGIRDRKMLAACTTQSEEGDPMYLAEILSDGSLKLKCPACSHEKIVAPPQKTAGF